MQKSARERGGISHPQSTGVGHDSIVRLGGAEFCQLPRQLNLLLELARGGKMPRPGGPFSTRGGGSMEGNIPGSMQTQAGSLVIGRKQKRCRKRREKELKESKRNQGDEVEGSSPRGLPSVFGAVDWKLRPGKGRSGPRLQNMDLPQTQDWKMEREGARYVTIFVGSFPILKSGQEHNGVYDGVCASAHQTEDGGMGGDFEVREKMRSQPRESESKTTSNGPLGA